MEASNTTRIGPTMRAITTVVEAMPGITKSDALREVGRPVSGLGCWRPIERVLAAGLVISVPGPHGHSLFRNERARRLHGLRQELLHGTPSPREVEQIRAEIDVLCAEQAATWAEA
jgi:hypothetical protein